MSDVNQSAGPPFRPMNTVPKDGTIVRLLVRYDHFDMGSNPLEDSLEPSWTIGHNSKDCTGEDEWIIAGWNWEQDCYTESTGEPIGWMPFHGCDQGETRWQSIETAPKNAPILLWSPPENLSHSPDQKADIRVSTTRDWCWATHWQPLPAPPSQPLLKEGQ